MKLPKKLNFLRSVRFWKLVGAGIVQALVVYGVITQDIAIPIQAILLGSAVIRTVDKFGENIK